MNGTNKKIVLAVVIVAVVGSIIYLEAIKPHQGPVTTVLQNIQNGTSSVAGGAAGLSPAQFLGSRATIVQQEEQKYQSAPEITDPSGFVNTAPFKLSDFVGKKVVLLDFWTYSCINCIRTIPYLNAWYQKYKDQGLVIVGIHTPEFDFEHDLANVQAAVQKFGIQYPVVLDNNMGTWSAYQNQYWPHEYLINIDGFIVHDHVGEGNYDATESAIQAALAERDSALGVQNTVANGMATPTNTISIDYGAVGSPETYFGAARNQYLANGTQGVPGEQSLSEPQTISANALYLSGTWDFADQYATNKDAGAKITYKYNSKNVYFVASANQPVTAQILLDGKPLGAAAGADVSPSGTVTIQTNRLYEIVHGVDYGTHTLQIIIQNPGLKAFTFTFG